MKYKPKAAERRIAFTEGENQAFNSIIKRFEKDIQLSQQVEGKYMSILPAIKDMYYGDRKMKILPTKSSGEKE